MRLTKRIAIVVGSFLVAVVLGVACIAVGVRLSPRSDLLFWLPLVLSLPLFLAAMVLATRGTRAWVQITLSVVGTLALEALFLVAFPLWGYAVVSYVPGR